MSMLSVVGRLSSSPWFRLMALLGLAALALLSLVPAEHSPPRTGLPGQIEHFIAYGCISALATFAFQHTVRTWQFAAAFVGYAAVLEIAQVWSPGRSASLTDFLGSSAGALVGISTCIILLHCLGRLVQVGDRQ